MGWIGFTLALMPCSEAAGWLRRIADALEKAGDRTLLSLPIRERAKHLEDLANEQLTQVLRGAGLGEEKQQGSKQQEGRKP